MKSRFLLALPALPAVASAKAGLCFTVFLCLFTTALHAQTDSIKITGITQPTCACNGIIDITVTGLGPSQPPATDYKYFWSNGFTTQDLFNLCPGNYCVTVTNGNINNFTSVKCFTVAQLPYTPLNIVSSNTAPCNTDSINMNNDCEKICPGTTVTYSVTVQSPNGTNASVNWQVSGASSWVVNNTGSSFFYSITVNWGGPGTGSVSVFSDAAGGNCTGEDALCVTIIDEPKAAFASSPAAVIAGGPLQVCLGQTVHFQNLSTGSADSYEWLFSDDLSISSLDNPLHTYMTPGMHTVRLIARSACLCADTSIMTVEVLNALAPSLQCVATICPGETVTYTATNGCTPFVWTVSGNGTVLNGGTSSVDSITVQWNGGPVGTITLGAQPCSGAACPLAAVIEIPIITSNAPIVGQDRVCPGSREIYTIEPFGGTGFVWTLPTGGTIVDGQGTNRVTVEWSNIPNPAPAADHTLYVQYTNCYLGCGGADFIHIRILPSFSMTGPIEVCQNSSGNFSSKLKTSNAALLCNWTLTAPDGSIGWTSTAATSTPNVPFLNGPGVYRLLATPDDPTLTCSNELDWAVTVRAFPAEPASISGETNICPGTAYTYACTGLAAGANIQWTMKNGGGATQTFNGNPLNVTWGAIGPYWLTAAQVSRDGLGCLSDTIGLVAMPIVSPIIAGTSVVCEDTKGTYSMLNLQNIDIQWSISPATAGAVANGQGSNQAEIFWSQAGGHVISISVCGQSAQLPVTVLSNPVPVIQYSAKVCPGFTELVQTVSPYTSYNWKDKTGTSLGSMPSIQLGEGVYSIDVIDANGCQGASAFDIKSWDAPNISLTTADPTGFCNNANTITLTALTNANGNYSYQWFQDGNPIVGASGSSYFTNQYGNYRVVATNAYGCTATAGPILLFNYCGGGGGGSGFPIPPSPFCAPGSINMIPDPSMRCDSFHLTLNDNSGLYIPGSASWITGVSGGIVVGTDSGDDANFVYPNAGKYIVLATVQLSNGTSCQVLDSVKVGTVARFNEQVDCSGALSNFIGRSELLPNVSITNYAWDFGDPASGINNLSPMENPSHMFSPAGLYEVNLTVTAASGCISSVTKQIEIPDSSPAVFGDPAANCVGNALSFTAAPNPDIIVLSWDFGDPASGPANDATGNPVYHEFPTGTYTVSTISSNVYGCTATFVHNVTVQASTLSGNISPANPAPLCEGSSITLSAPAGAVSYLWSDGSTSTSLTVGLEGNYKVTLTDANGCTYSPAAVKVDINPAPDALIKALIFNTLGQVIGNSYPTVTICAGEDLALQAFSNGAGNYSWSGGNGVDQVLFYTDDRNTLLPVGTHLYTVTVTNSSTGCTAVSDPFVVTVNPVPSGFFVSSPTYCAGSPNVLSYTGPTPANWQFFWNTGASGPSLTTKDPGSYYIRVINEFGCEAKSNVQTILPGPPVGSIPAGCHTRCKPDTLCIPSLPNITSWQWFLNGSPISGANSANFIAQQSGTYWAELTDLFGCSAQSDPLSLNLFDGYGNILGHTWSDVNNNGIIDAADTLISGITVVVYQNGSLFDAPISGPNGDFALTNVLSTNYTFVIDPFSLPPNWSIIIGNDQTILSGCDVEGNADFLLHYACQAFGTLQLSACSGGFATYNGTNISTGGSQSFHLSTGQGCDSTLIVSVVALPPVSSSLNLLACPGSTVHYSGTDLAINAVQLFTFQTAQGCDSVVTVTVSEANHTVVYIDGAACAGDFYVYQGANILAGTTAIVTNVNAAGCLDTAIVTALVLPSNSSSVALHTCPGGTANYNGTNLAIGAVQAFTFQNSFGCDSVVTVTVSALPTSAKSITLSTCPGSTVSYNGSSLAIGVSQDFTFPNWLGCDSVVTVTVSALPTSANSITLSTCPGSTVLYNGSSLTIGVSQDFTFPNWRGCDSVVTVTVTALPTSSSAFSVGVCPGDVYTYQNTPLSAGTVQDFSLSNAAGCDSIVTVTVFQKQVSANVLDISVCPGSTYFYGGTEIAAGDSREFHFSNKENCDSTVTVFVSAFPTAVFGLNAEPSCANSATGVLEATGIFGGAPPYRFSLNMVDFQDSTRFLGITSGAYTLYVEDANGCVFKQDTVLATLPALEVQLANGILPCDSTGVLLKALVLSGDTSSLQYKWWNGSLSSTNLATEVGTVWVEVTDQCETLHKEASVKWAELAKDNDIVYVPNVFMPEARNSENSAFKPLFAAGLSLVGFHFAVYDRWGNELFETSNTTDGWGGVFRDQHFNPGVLVWYLEADVAICGRILHLKRKGDVTIVR